MPAAQAQEVDFVFSGHVESCDDADGNPCDVAPLIGQLASLRVRIDRSAVGRQTGDGARYDDAVVEAQINVGAVSISLTCPTCELTQWQFPNTDRLAALDIDIPPDASRLEMTLEVAAETEDSFGGDPALPVVDCLPSVNEEANGSVFFEFAHGGQQYYVPVTQYGPRCGAAIISVVDERAVSSTGPYQCAPTNFGWTRRDFVRSISVPQSGATQASNHFDRIFKVVVGHPEDDPPDNAEFRVIRVGAGNQIDTDGRADSATLLASTPTQSTYCLKVTDVRSPAQDGSAPPFVNFKYRMQLRDPATGQFPAPTQSDAAAETGNYLSLWDMPESWVWISDGLRYSQREPDGDEWMRLGTYRWLDRVRTGQAGALVPQQLYINDISCEHGRNCEHKTHGQGKHIDVNHRWPNPGGLGGNNYAAIENAARALATAHNSGQALPQGDLSMMQAWVATTRPFVAAVLADPYVAQLIGISGPKVGLLRLGWASTALRCGTIPYESGNANASVPLGIGTIDVAEVACGGALTARTLFQNNHKDHWHIDINAQALEALP